MGKIQGKQIESITMNQATMPDSLKVTTDVGEVKIPDGQTFIAISQKHADGRDKTAWELLNELFSKDNDPVITQPSVTIATNAYTNKGYIESGKTVTDITMTLTFNKGLYPFGSFINGELDITKTTPEYDSTTVDFNFKNGNDTIKIDNLYKSGFKGTIPSLVINDGDVIKMAGVVLYSDSTNIPASQLGSIRESLKIVSGGKSSDFKTIVTSYRPIFYGGVTVDNVNQITASIIRGLPQQTTAPYNKATTLPTLKVSNTPNAKGVVIAIPTREITSSRTGIKISGGVFSIIGLRTDVTANFVKSNTTISVPDFRGENAIPYTIWSYFPASLGNDNQYEINLA